MTCWSWRERGVSLDEVQETGNCYLVVLGKNGAEELGFGLGLGFNHVFTIVGEEEELA